jgi:hypothetical protein
LTIPVPASAIGMLTVSFSSAAFAATIVTCFAPEQDCAGLAIGAIDVAGYEILVNAYAFTTEMREFLGNLYKEISIENSQKLDTYPIPSS